MLLLRLSRRGEAEEGGGPGSGSGSAIQQLLRTGAVARAKVMQNWGVIGGVAAALAASIYVLWGPITERRKRRKGLVPGLLNLGNTCFMNSLLQGLSACPSMIKWLDEFTAQQQHQPSPAETPGRSHSLALTLLRLLKALSCQEEMEEDLLDASCLLEVLRTYRWQISSFEEQDAHELFHILTSSLEEERDGQPRVTHLFDVHALEQPEMPPKEIRCRTRGPTHPMSRHWKLQLPFHGRLTSNMVCKNCRHQSPLRYDTFDSLSLSIPATKWGHPLTLDQCLHHFISSESVMGVVCENCTKIQAEGPGCGQTLENQRTTFVKQLKLGKLPQCLCIHLQRLSWSSHGMPLKRNEHVQFSEFLVMDVYKHHFLTQKLNPKDSRQSLVDTKDDVEQMGSKKSSFMNGTCPSPLLSPPSAFSAVTSPDCSSPAYLYRLMAVVVHHGDMHSGHFVTYRRSPQSYKSLLATANQWLWISDDVVRKTTLQEVLSSAAYLLFYERVHSRWQPQNQRFRVEE